MIPLDVKIMATFGLWLVLCVIASVVFIGWMPRLYKFFNLMIGLTLFLILAWGFIMIWT